MADTQHGRSDPYESNRQETDIKTHPLIMIPSLSDLYIHISLLFNLIPHYAIANIFKTDYNSPVSFCNFVFQILKLTYEQAISLKINNI